jgi:hypothetical protein
VGTPNQTLTNILMTTTIETTNRPVFNLGAPLLPQLEEIVGNNKLQAIATEAYSFLENLLATSAQEQSTAVSKLGLTTVTSLDVGSNTSIANTLMAIMLLEATKLGNMTAHEKIQRTLRLLSYRYQADW